nr:MAG TPA: hypothetical protein [Caudoviricetes sp.]
MLGGILLIKMLPSYDDYCKLHHLEEPCTSYLLEELPNAPVDWYTKADSFITGLHRGSFKLYYALKSYPSNQRDDKFAIYFVTNYGLFVKDLWHSVWDFPLDFRTVSARQIHSIGAGDIIINHTDRRTLLPLYNVRFTEIIDGVAQPNSFDSTEIYHCLKAKTHQLLLSSDEYEPILVDFDINLYRALRERRFYLHIRLDNYIKYREIRLWHPRL